MATPAGAVCAQHPDQQASTICDRCGNFMCVLCTEGGVNTTCPACRVRTGATGTFPFNRENYEFGAIWNYCFETWKREWVMLSVAVMLMFIGVAVGGVFNQIAQAIAMPQLEKARGAEDVLKVLPLVIPLFILGGLVQNIVQGILQMGLFRILADAMLGKKVDIAAIFSQLGKAKTYVVFALIVFGIVLVPLLVVGGLVGGVMYALGPENPAAIAIAALAVVIAIPALIYFTLPLYLGAFEIAFNDGVSPMDAFRNCYKLADGHRLSIFGYFFMSGLVTMIGFFACCIGVLPAAALGQMLTVALYLSLSNHLTGKRYV